MNNKFKKVVLNFLKLIFESIKNAWKTQIVSCGRYKNILLHYSLWIIKQFLEKKLNKHSICFYILSLLEKIETLNSLHKSKNSTFVRYLH